MLYLTHGTRTHSAQAHPLRARYEFMCACPSRASAHCMQPVSTEPVTLDFLDFNLKYLVNEKELLYNKGVAPDQRVEIYSKMR